MPGRITPPIRRKWRPPLALVIGGTLAAVLLVPVVAIGHFKLAGFILGWGETTLMMGMLAGVITLLLAFLLWRLVLRPVTALTAYANAVKDGRENAPLPAHFGTPELTDLARSVHDMASTLQDREAGLRAYTNHVTHELKSPLTSLIGAAELLQDDPSAEDHAKLIDTIQASAQTMQTQLDALRTLAKARTPLGRGPARLSEAAHEIEPRLNVTLSGDADLPIDPQALRAVLTHLAQNAADHGATRLHINATTKGFTMHDNGPGIAPGNRSRIFEPFFTTRRATGGTGMGLAITRSMLEAAGGRIALLPRDQGAAFEVLFD